MSPSMDEGDKTVSHFIEVDFYNEPSAYKRLQQNGFDGLVYFSLNRKRV